MFILNETSQKMELRTFDFFGAISRNAFRAKRHFTSSNVKCESYATEFVSVFLLMRKYILVCVCLWVCAIMWEYDHNESHTIKRQTAIANGNDVTEKKKWNSNVTKHRKKINLCNGMPTHTFVRDHKQKCCSDSWNNFHSVVDFDRCSKDQPLSLVTVAYFFWLFFKRFWKYFTFSASFTKLTAISIIHVINVYVCA